MILVATTVAEWKCGDGKELAWLRNADAMRKASPVELRFMAAVQISDMGGPLLPEVFHPLCERLDGWWTFYLGGGAWAPTTRERLIGITTGRNLIREYALRDTDVSHVLFLDTDLEAPGDCIPKLLELDHPVVGGEVPSYCLHGPPVEGFGDLWVEEHWNTAGFLLVRRDVLNQVAWRWSPDGDITDDPSFALDVERAGFGKTWVRKADCVGLHEPLIPVEARR